MRGGAWEIQVGDALERLPEMEAESVQTCVTSPPYWNLRDYDVEGQLGMEATPEEYVANLVRILAEVRRVLRPDGTLWLNIGDSYATGSRSIQLEGQGGLKQDPGKRKRGGPPPPGLKNKDLVGVPWMVAFALRAEGWYLRSETIWSKTNPMPASVKDRPSVSHETLFLLSRGPRYFYDQDAIREPHSGVSIARAKRNRFGGKYADSDPAEHGRLKAGANYGPDGDASKIVSPGGRNAWSVWEVPEDLWVQFMSWVDSQPERIDPSVWKLATYPYPGAHFATFPVRLARPCILAGSRKGDVVLDPFSGAATTAIAALSEGRDFAGVELSADYAEQGRDRIRRWEANPSGELTGDPEPIHGQIGLEL